MDARAIIDNFFDETRLEAVRNEVLAIPEGAWVAKLNKSPNEVDKQYLLKKKAINRVETMGPACRDIFAFLASADMIQYLEKMTGIQGLCADPLLYGGGLHKITEGGWLAVHADYNLHPKTHLHRRINVIVYLNRDWKPEYNGELEFWNTDLSECVERVAPLFNRMVIFKNTDTSWHGHPAPWQAPYDRLSIATYYYTVDRPAAEISPFHWTTWQKNERNAVGYGLAK